MGSVYLARHSQTGQQVSIKFLSGEFEAKPEFVTRFMNEAAACARLDHENIIRVFKAGQEDGTHFMVMEFVDGVDLSHFLQVQEKVKEAQALPWLKQSAYALAYAHKQNIVHRDLKPENIMINRENVVKVADLGLSKTMGQKENLSMTMSGTVIGTPYYISPEQARDAKRVDSRADIYSLGATFYHLLTGRPPFQGNSAAEVMSKHMHEPLVDPGRINIALNDGICALITKMMEKDPGRRFQTLEELIEAIGRVERGEEAIPGRVKLRRSEVSSDIQTAPPFWKRFSVRKLAIGAGVAVVAAFLAFIIFSSPKQKPPSVVPVHLPVTATNTMPTGSGSPTVGTVTNADPIPPAPENGTTMVQATNATPELPIESGTTNLSPITPPSPPKKLKPSDEERIIDLPSAPPTAGGLGGVSFRSINWVDGIGLLILFVGIPAAQKVGWIWGTVRAGAFWLAMYILFLIATPSISWLQTRLNFPPAVAAWLAFLVLSAILLMIAWVSTQRLYGTGKDKDTLRNKVGRTIAILPGLVLGWAFAIWAVTLLMMLNSSDVPADTSWTGSWVKKTFPSVEEVVKKSKEKGPPEKPAYR